MSSEEYSSEEYSNEEESECSDARTNKNRLRNLGLLFGNGNPIMSERMRLYKKVFETSDMSFDEISLDGVDDDKHYEYVKNALRKCIARITSTDWSYICRVNGKLEIIPYEKLMYMSPFTQRMASVRTKIEKYSYSDEETIKTITKKFPISHLLDRPIMRIELAMYSMAEAKKLVEDQK